MNFHQALHRILQKLVDDEGQRSKYTEDAVEIQNHVIEKLKLTDDNFRKAFDGLSLGGSYLDRVKLNTPDEFDLHMKLKFPFLIIPTNNEKGFVFLRTHVYNHPIVDGHYINRKNLQVWLRKAFDEVFKSNVKVRCKSGEVYDVMYTSKGYGCAHTIEAEGKKRTISFDFVPAFEFAGTEWPLSTYSKHQNLRSFPWFAVPQRKPGSSDEKIFIVCAPHWEREITQNLLNFKNVLRLMKGLRDAHKTDFPHLSSYMLKTVLLHQLGNVSWTMDLPNLFIKMWNCLVVCLKNGKLEFYWAAGHNIFDRMQPNQLKKCRESAEYLLVKLQKIRSSDSGQMLAELFQV
ncbi:uncharacterized protein [Drosophila pseudoobscura]|uniref:Cyclic GMP-AMP synthase n=1 Tax=Drosophila pseudoobscura pseudoobscura TaxID=46245 RepID=A0A6I8V120_DROPS|nr:uncharacterized protein LOC6900849 [Drosophila pseudoobscura]